MSITNPIVTTSYLSALYAPGKAKETLNYLLGVLTEHREKFDGLVFTGSSGAIALACAAMLDLPALHVRKDMGHACHPVEGQWVERLCFIDDFIATGQTVGRVKEAIDRHNPYSQISPKPALSLIVLYNQGTYYRMEYEGVQITGRNYDDLPL